MRELDLIKPPGVAESIDWAGALVALGARTLDPDTGRRHAGRGPQVPRGRRAGPRRRPGGPGRRGMRRRRPTSTALLVGFARTLRHAGVGRLPRPGADDAARPSTRSASYAAALLGRPPDAVRRARRPGDLRRGVRRLLRRRRRRPRGPTLPVTRCCRSIAAPFAAGPPGDGAPAPTRRPRCWALSASPRRGAPPARLRRAVAAASATRCAGCWRCSPRGPRARRSRRRRAGPAGARSTRRARCGARAAARRRADPAGPAAPARAAAPAGAAARRVRLDERPTPTRCCGSRTRPSAAGPPCTEVFTVGTRLTRVTRALRHRDPDAALPPPPRRSPTGTAAPGWPTRLRRSSTGGASAAPPGARSS